LSASAISRKKYQQVVYFQSDLKSGKNFVTYTFRQDDTSIIGPMIDATGGDTSFGLAGQQDPYNLDVSTYFSDPNKVTIKAIRTPPYASSEFDISTSTKPATASQAVPDYVTYIIFVEDTSDGAQVAGSGKFDDQAVTVNLVKMNPNPIPPEPPKNVIPGYNPVLDRPRPSTLPNYLKAYDVVFLLDDSGSMKGDRWTEAKNALNGLANYVIQNGWDSNGIDLSFLNSTSKFNFAQISNLQDMGKVGEAIDKITPDGGTPTGKRCKEILGAHVDKLNAAKGTPAYGTLKPLDLICITDGESNDPAPDELVNKLIEAGNKIKAGPHHPNSMGVQFVQIGNDAKIKALLDLLVQADTGHMVDTVPYAGPGSISPDKLVRILLGGLHPNIRALIP